MIAKKRYSKVRALFDANPKGLTLNEVCEMYRDLYPDEPRDCSAYVCGQESFGNFKKTGFRGDEAIYVSATPTKEERVRCKMRATKANIASSVKTYKKCEDKLRRILKGDYTSTEDLFDFGNKE